MYYVLMLSYCVDSYTPAWIHDMAELVETNADVHFFPDRDSAIDYGEGEMRWYRGNYENKNNDLQFEYQETDEPTDDYYWRRMTSIDPTRSEMGGLYGFVEFRVGKVEQEE